MARIEELVQMWKYLDLPNSKTITDDGFFILQQIADWYEDTGDHKHAQAYRWIADNQSRAFQNAAGSFAMYIKSAKLAGDPRSDIPDEIFRLLQIDKESPLHENSPNGAVEGTFRYYTTFAKSFEALVAAVIKWQNPKEEFMQWDQ